jgi:hypothetical protein
MNKTQIDRFVELCRLAGLKPSYIAKKMGISLTSLRHYLEVHPAPTIKAALKEIEDLEDRINYLKRYLEVRKEYVQNYPEVRRKAGRPKNIRV